MKFNKKVLAGITAASLILGTAGIAGADDAQLPTADVTGAARGATVPASVWLEQNDSGDPVDGCNATSTAKVTINFASSNAAVASAPAAVELEGCGEANGVSFNVLVKADAPYEASTQISIASATGGRTQTVMNGPNVVVQNSNNKIGGQKFSITVQSAPTNSCDSISAPAAPVFTVDAAPTTGWFTTAPTAAATSATSDATVTYATGDPAGTFSATVPTLVEGPTDVTAKATSATCNKTSTASRQFKVDTQAPTADKLSVANTTWRNSSLPETFTFSDPTPGSGLAPSQGLNASNAITLTAAAESTKNADGIPVPTTVSKTVSDVAGHEVTRSVSALIDLTKPRSTVQGVVEGAVYAVAPGTCSATDSLSGVASHGTATHSGSTAGVQSVSCNGATDNAGNIQTGASDSVSYTLAPISGENSNFDGSAVLKVKPNQAIPLKWAFHDGTNNVALLSTASILTQNSTKCTSEAGTNGTETAETTTGSSGLQLLLDNSYQMNWKASSTTGCRAVTVTMTPQNGAQIVRTILISVQK